MEKYCPRCGSVIMNELGEGVDCDIAALPLMSGGERRLNLWECGLCGFAFFEVI